MQRQRRSLKKNIKQATNHANKQTKYNIKI